MNLQFISDNTGKTTGVFIPIEEWIALKDKFKGIEDEEIDVPAWQKDIVRARVEDYKSNPDQVLNFDEAINNIENSL